MVDVSSVSTIRALRCRARDSHVSRSMRGLAIDATGSLDQVRYRTDLPIPEPPPGWLRVRITRAALNHLDLFTVRGLPGVTVTPGWVLGCDGTGVIDALGDAIPDSYDVALGARVVINAGVNTVEDEYVARGEHPLSPGFRVLGEHLPGTCCEYVCVPARNVRVIPAHIPDDVAAGYTLATLTAWRMCVTRAQIHADDDVLIWGIGGGVALAALQICKARGAHVRVTSSSDDKLARARALGADDTINHRGIDVGKAIRARTNKRGVTVVIDSVGTATWPQSLGALGRGGRLVTCGGTSGAMVETDVRRLFWNQWTLMGSTMGTDDEFSAVVDALRADRLTAVIDSEFPLGEGRAALERLESGAQFGKIVLRV
jgi:NADPH:quinone reductase-like Zn-dependent oxidoreductase